MLRNGDSGLCGACVQVQQSEENAKNREKKNQSRSKPRPRVRPSANHVGRAINVRRRLRDGGCGYDRSSAAAAALSSLSVTMTRGDGVTAMTDDLARARSVYQSYWRHVEQVLYKTSGKRPLRQFFRCTGFFLTMFPVNVVYYTIMYNLVSNVVYFTWKSFFYTYWVLYLLVPNQSLITIIDPFIGNIYNIGITS